MEKGPNPFKEHPENELKNELNRIITEQQKLSAIIMNLNQAIDRAKGPRSVTSDLEGLQSQLNEAMQAMSDLVEKADGIRAKIDQGRDTLSRIENQFKDKK